MDTMNTTMTLRDISELLKISEQTARTRVRQGKAMPPSFKTGQRRLFLTLEVQKWLIAQTSASGGPSADDGQTHEMTDGGDRKTQPRMPAPSMGALMT